MNDRANFDEEAFARMLDGADAPRTLDERRMASLIEALERSRPAVHAATGPRPAFATALRDRLDAEAGVLQDAARAARIPLKDRVVIRLRARNDAWKRSFRVVTATGLAAVMMLGAGAALAGARHSVPGQWNYALKRGMEGARLSVTHGALSRGYLQLDLARERLKEVRQLSETHSRNQTLYVDTLSDMDHSTVEAAELLITASRSGAGELPLTRLSGFAAAQRLRLEGLVDGLPAGVRPAARDSISVLFKLSDRVAVVLAGCPCPANPLEIPTALPAGSTNPAAPGCSCSTAAPTNHPEAAGANDDNVVSSPSPTPNPTGTASASPAPSPSSGGSDLVPGTRADDPVNGAVDGVLKNLGITPPPLPLPTPSPSLHL